VRVQDLTMFRKILIANRGEIAIRVMRACREMGIATATVYSQADRRALHVRYADEAYCIGPPPATDSYLRKEAIIEAARACGAEALHPGYGFLAENPDFVEAVREAGLVFIGPSPETMRLVGDKTAARRTVRESGVPVVPGGDHGIDDDDEALRVAGEMGFPVLIKAAAGGGGKGMRIVSSAEELPAAMKASRSESRSSFGDATVYIEKYLAGARHVEFQIMGDERGNLVHLGERECSVQRRYQKLIEESPSWALDPALRRKMGQAALKVARAAGYTNAGTVEFLLAEDGRFYFLEVNARLQVEHPVTEMVTGVDLVKEQIRVAAGEKLGFTQEDVHPSGCALECRIYAEDPDNDFFPSTGIITGLHHPKGPWIRNDSSLYPGMEVTVYYDPLLSKLLIWGRTRQELLDRAAWALEEYRIAGIKTTVDFCAQVLSDPDFRSGQYHTGIIPKMQRHHRESADKDLEIVALAAALTAWHGEKKRRAVSLFKGSPEIGDPWKLAGRRHNLSGGIWER
jgi:acetyl-CoA carboxylase biotin carboxylase subunit